jgi:hypothetical protein
MSPSPRVLLVFVISPLTLDMDIRSHQARSQSIMVLLFGELAESICSCRHTHGASVCLNSSLAAAYALGTLFLPDYTNTRLVGMLESHGANVILIFHYAS